MTQWKSELFCTAFNKGQLPPAELEEIVFAGRSNVGKSTLTNALLGRSIAKVSSKPGKTRSINFYRVETQQADKFMLVDIPGYGYAVKSAVERKAWWKLIEDYFASDRKISFVVHLVDFRHGLLANDIELENWLDEIDMPRLIVYTKADKIPKGKRKGLYDKYAKDGLQSVMPPFLTSGINNSEMDALRVGLVGCMKELRKISD